MEGRSDLSAAVRPLPPISDVLARARRRERLDRLDAIRLLEAEDGDIEAICEHAAELRDEVKGRIVTYSPKLFLAAHEPVPRPLRLLHVPQGSGDDGAWTMTEEEVAAGAGAARSSAAARR